MKVLVPLKQNRKIMAIDNKPPDLSHLNLRTQVIQVLYVMNCDSDLLDMVELYPEARGESYVLDLDSPTEAAEAEHPLLGEIIAISRNAGFKTIVLTS
jgi:hypothetical protein